MSTTPPTYYVAHVRLQEAHGTCTEKVLCVYRVDTAWNAAHAIVEAKKNGAMPMPTVEYLHASRSLPFGYSGEVI